MKSSVSRAAVVRFGVFALDLRAGELLKHGTRLRLQEQPFQILEMLLSRPGELVTREEIHQRLWPKDTFTDFDHGLNNAVNRLRDALGDSADTPRFVETLHRRGYRFIAPVIEVIPEEELVEPQSDSAAQCSLVAARSERLGEELVIPSVPEGDGLVQWRPLAGWHALGSRLVLVPYIFAIVFLLAAMTGWTIYRARQASQRTAPATIRSIAVLPFENLSGDSSQEYFADGMTDSLITSLARISSLRVTSRTSVMHYKGSHQTLPEIAKDLNVDAVLEGSVQRSGDRVRINVQLIRADTDRHLWADAYDRELRDVLKLESDVARAVATEIEVKSTGAEKVHLASAQSVNPVSYESYLKGRYYLQKRTEEELRKSEGYFEDAIRADPGFAPAYAGLSDYYSLLCFRFAGIFPSEAMSKATAAASKAIELDESLSEAHASLGFIKHRFEWDWAGAEREFNRAIELDPSNSNAYLRYAQLLHNLGRREEGMASLRRAEQLDPLSLAIQRSIADTYTPGQIGQVTETYEKMLRFDPNSSFTHGVASMLLERQGKHDQAVHELEVGGADGPVQNWLGELGYYYATNANKAQAENVLEQLIARSKKGSVSWQIALIYAGLGRKDDSLFWLQRAYEERSPQLVLFYGPFHEKDKPTLQLHSANQVNQTFNLLHSDPRFQELAQRIGKLVPPAPRPGV